MVEWALRARDEGDGGLYGYHPMATVHALLGMIVFLTVYDVPEH